MDREETVVPGARPYSGRNRIPNIKQFMESLDRDKRERDAKIEAEQQQKQKQKQQQENQPQKQQQPGEAAGEHQETGRRAGKNRRTVRDPVTGKDVEIDDVDGAHVAAAKDPMLSVPNANLGKESTVRTEATQSGEEYRRNQDVTAPPDPVAEGATSDVPIHGEKTNVLFHPMPAVSYEPAYAALETKATVLAVGLFLAVALLGGAFGGSMWGMLPLAVCVASAVFFWAKELVRRGRSLEWASESRRGETAVVNLVPESVEWLNTAVGLVWGLINPDMFAAVADTLEDVMQASVPGVIENVKVNDISQGTNPIRILSLRALPDSHVQDLKDEMGRRDEGAKDEQERAADEEGGDFYNLEATVAYHSLPSSGDVSSKARNMSMQLVFYLGVRGLFGVPLPIWVELDGLLCTTRIRVGLSPNPPFVKTLGFTLMGLPKVQASCVPLVERGANVLNLPVISNFVNWAIAAAAGMYVAPRSMSLDVGKMLQGDDVKKETEALGVLLVRIHRATGLSKQDRRGSVGGGSDPYVCVAFSKFGKPQYCTRVIQDDLNPVFSETCALLVTPDVVKADEQLSLELWDSDRSSADDVVGKVELSIQKLIQHPGKSYPQVSRLRGVKAESSMPGELHWDLGFFAKSHLRRALRTDGRDPNLPPDLRHEAELQDDRGTINTAEEDAVVHTPPDPLWPSGILSIVVHQVVNLELQNVKGSQGKRKGREYEPARPEAGDATEERGKKLPSSYCTVLLNDELIYKTRTKVVSSKPIFQAGTERFVRDWRSCIVTVTVRDARNRQHDPIIGVVPLRLSDILQSSSQSTRWYPLDGGIGFGRIRIGLLFRSVALRLPPPQLGFGEIGTFEFLSDHVTTDGFAPHARLAVRLRTGGSSAVLRPDTCRRSDDGRSLSWDVSGGAAAAAADRQHGSSRGIRLPVRFRYRSPVFFEFRTPGKRHGEFFASLWLQDVADNQEVDADLPIWRCSNGLRLSQNYVTEANCKTVPDLDLQEVGRLRFRGRFKPGTDRDHLKFVSDNDSRETIESWEACFAEGVRREVVEREVPPAVQKMHQESLTKDRDVLARASEEDKKKWLAKDGTDWSGAFGKEPAELLGRRSHEGEDDGDEEKGSDQDSSDADLGIQDANTQDGDKASQKASTDGDHSPSTRPSADAGTSTSTGSGGSKSRSDGPIQAFKDYRDRSRDLHRQHRGLMQWRPVRNVQFAKDEALFAARRIKNMGGLTGRKPDVETEV